MVSSKWLRLGSCFTLDLGRWNQPAWPLVFLWPFPICSLLGFVLWKAFAHSFLPSVVCSFLTKVYYPPAVCQIPGHRGTKQRNTVSLKGGRSLGMGETQSNNCAIMCQVIEPHCSSAAQMSTGKARMLEFVSVWGTLLVKLGSPREGRKVWEGKEGQGRSCWMCEERILEGTQKHTLSRTQQYLGGWG